MNQTPRLVISWLLVAVLLQGVFAWLSRRASGVLGERVFAELREGFVDDVLQDALLEVAVEYFGVARDRGVRVRRLAAGRKRGRRGHHG